MRRLLTRVWFIGVLAAGGCGPGATTIDCGEGGTYHDDGARRLCAYGVIAGGFSCPAGLSFRHQVPQPGGGAGVICADGELTGPLSTAVCADAGAAPSCTPTLVSGTDTDGGGSSCRPTCPCPSRPCPSSTPTNTDGGSALVCSTEGRPSCFGVWPGCCTDGPAEDPVCVMVDGTPQWRCPEGLIDHCDCDPVADAAHCDQRTTAGYCQEYGGFESAALDAYQGVCTSSSGEWALTPCSREGALGGCRGESALGSITNWFYEGGPYDDAAAVMQVCAADESSTFVEP